MPIRSDAMRSAALVLIAVVATVGVQQVWAGLQPVPVAAQVTPSPTATPVPTPSPTPTPTPVPTATPLAYPSLDPHRVVVSFGADDGALEIGLAVRAQMPTAWATATRNRSQLVSVGSLAAAPIYVTFHDIDARDRDTGNERRGIHASLAGGRVHVIDVYPPRSMEVARVVRIVVHELGHALGCCTGTQATNTHWKDCTDELMCSDVAPDPRREVFSDRELAQMGLGS